MIGGKMRHIRNLNNTTEITQLKMGNKTQLVLYTVYNHTNAHYFKFSFSFKKKFIIRTHINK